MNVEKMTVLVSRAQKGDGDALSELISDCYQDIYYFALKTVKNEDLAADITQESCMEIISTIDKLREPAAFAVWSRRITYHQCTRYFKKTKDVLAEEDEDGETVFDSLADDESIIPEQIAEDKEFQRTILDMIDSLPPEQRSAVVLHYYEGMSVKEIARIHDTTEGTVKSRLNYGRKAIKAKVEEYEKKTGVMLHGILPFPLMLRFLLRLGEEAERRVPPTAILEAAKGAGSLSGSAAASGATVSVAKKAGGALVLKIAAAIIAAGIAIGGAVVGVGMLNDSPPPSDEEQTDEKESSPSHKHKAERFGYDEEEHWGICKCGRELPGSKHEFEGRECKTCGKVAASTGLEFELFEDHAEVKGIGECTDTHIVFPSVYDGLPVTAIGKRCFVFSKIEIVRVTVPDSVTTIGDEAFDDCDALKEVELGAGVKSIGEGAFWGCDSLESITLPESVTEIGASAFGKCTSLREIEVPAGVSEISDSAFFKCTSLERVSLGDGLKRIGSSAFSECSSLREIKLPEGLESIDYAAFWECTALRSIVVPSSVTSLGTRVFRECVSLESAEINASIPELPTETFYCCSAITRIVLPQGLQSLGRLSVSHCSSLESIALPTSLNLIGSCAFYFCTALKSVEIPDSVELMLDQAFSNCTSLRSVRLSSGMTEIPRQAFEDCNSLESVEISGSVHTLYERAFEGCESLRRITVPKSVRVISMAAFVDCPLLSVVEYEGTTDEWRSINVDFSAFVWGTADPPCTVVCSNGELVGSAIY